MLYLQSGTKIRAFTLDECLGKGGMSSVWRAVHAETKQLYALKVLHGSLADDEVVRQRFVEEGLIQARVSHPHVVAVKGRIEAHPVHALVMEFIDGPTLDQTVRERPIGLLLSEVKTISTGLLSALNAAHRRDIVHRDVKPSNVLLAQEMYSVTPKLTDFGIAKFKYGRSRTVTGAPMGTPHFMSPEQLRDSKSVTVRSDIYSFGVTLYYMVTGTYPYDNDDLNALMVQIVSGKHEPASHYRTNLPAPIDELIESCMAHDGQRRPESCREVLERILAIDWTDEQDASSLRRTVTGEASAVVRRSAELEAVKARISGTHPPAARPSSRPTSVSGEVDTAARTQQMSPLQSMGRKGPPPIPADAIGEGDYFDPSVMGDMDLDLEPDDDLADSFRPRRRPALWLLFALLLIAVGLGGYYLAGTGNQPDPRAAGIDAGGEEPIAADDSDAGQPEAEATPTDDLPDASATAEGSGSATPSVEAGTEDENAGLSVASADGPGEAPVEAAAQEVAAVEPPEETTTAPREPTTPRERTERRRDDDSEPRARERESRPEPEEVAADWREQERQRRRDQALNQEPTPFNDVAAQAADVLRSTSGRDDNGQDSAQTATPPVAVPVETSTGDPSASTRRERPEPTELTPLQVNSSLRSERSAFRNCFAPSDGSSVTMRINIRPDGTVGYASATGDGADPVVVRCLVQVLSAVRFDSFDGPAMNHRHRFTRAGP